MRNLATVGLLVVACSCADGEGDAAGRLRFVALGKEAYRFDTGQLRGALRAGGTSRGLTGVVHVPTGTRIDAAAGLFSHYRVFAGDTRYGSGAWDWPSHSRLLADGAVRVEWPATDERPFEMTAVYRWVDPSTLDVETTVRAKGELRGFESFLASYFSKAFPEPQVCVRGADGEPAFVPAGRQDGEWQMFPRDDKAVPLIQDGRWQRPPHPVAWAIRLRLAAPLALRRAAEPGLLGVVMARPDECFAVATPFSGEGHRSLYLSLFGRDLRAGETATARTRLVITSSRSDAEVLALYRAFTATPRP